MKVSTQFPPQSGHGYSDLAELKISYVAADTLAVLHGSLPLGAVSIVAVFHSMSVLRSSPAQN